MNEKLSCPCKKVSLRLSSQTAAEFGDLHRIVETASRLGDHTPLQLAAQHGHTAVTAYLLQKTAPSVDGLKTPLHRACFSGAVSTMRLILDFANEKHCLEELLLAPDTSFGDQRNALHKAAAGGRFLAVHCLLEYCCGADFLTCTDGQGHTARDISVSLRLRQSEEAKSVARWNVVAGGLPDWDKCVQLLRRAEFQSIKSDREKKTQWAPLAPHLVSAETLSCTDCSATDGRCLTKAWEYSFQSSLESEVEKTLRNPLSSASLGHDFLFVSEKIDKESDQPLQEKLHAPCELHKASDKSSSTTSNSQPLGQKCSKCHNVSIALYRRNGFLVCRKCR